jgi:hypothetical protein
MAPASSGVPRALFRDHLDAVLSGSPPADSEGELALVACFFLLKNPMAWIDVCALIDVEACS